MEWTSWLGLLDAHEAWIAREILQRGVAAVFVLAFLSTLHQFPVLLGERGLLPVPEFLERAGDRAGPTLFRRLGYSDVLLRGMCVAGMLLGIAVVLGLPQQGPAWSMLAVFGAMWAMYLSIVSAGQVFYGFGWESMLLECGALMGLLGSHAVPPPAVMMLFLAWLLIRLEFGAGMIKMRGDASWRDLTAMDHHHETQPMPGPLSRTAHLMPRWWHRAEVLGSHAVQLGLVWLVLAPQPLAVIGALAVILTQLFLVLTGNYAWLNWLTILVACAAIPDAFWRWLAGGPAPGWSWFGVSFGGSAGAEGGPGADGAAGAGGTAGVAGSSPLWWSLLVLAAFLGLAVLSRKPLANLLSPHQLMNASFDRFHLVNAYGAFGSMTERRYEVLLEGTEHTAGEDAPEEAWRPYEFRGKPGDLRRLPRQFAPYHLRLDWQMWFLALRPGTERWFVALLERLADGDRGVRRLLARDPFDGRAPTALRVRYCCYRFATRQEARASGERWVAMDLGIIARL